MQQAKSRLLTSAALALSAVLPAPVFAASLAELYQQALQNDLTLQTATHQRDAAVEASPQALGALLPQLTADGTIRKNRFIVNSINTGNTTFRPTEEGYNTTEYAVSLTQTLFDWSAFKALDQADSQVAQAEAAYRSAQQSLIARFVQAYFNVLASQDKLRADLDAQAAFKQQLDQQQDKYKSGVATVTDAKNAQASFDSSSARVIADRNAVSAAKRALSTIVGKQIDSVDPLQEDIALVAPNPATVESWADASALNNFDVMAARRAAEAAGYKADSSRAKHLPTLTAAGTMNWSDSESKFGYDGETDYIGVTLNLDLYRGGQIASIARQAEASQLASEAQYKLQLRKTDQSVRDHYDGIINGIAGVKASAAAVGSNQSSVIATEVGFKVGTRTVIDVLNSRQALAEAQKTLSQSRYDYLLNLMLLKSDVGQLSVADIEELDRLLVRGGAPRVTPPQK